MVGEALYDIIITTNSRKYWEDTADGITLFDVTLKDIEYLTTLAPTHDIIMRPKQTGGFSNE